MANNPNKNDEMALLAHDLRTPLSAMRLTAELIGTEALSEQQSERLQLLIRSIDALSETAGALIQVSGNSSFWLNLHEVVSDTADLFRVAADVKGLALVVDLPPIEASLGLAQAGALRRVVTALLDNAVKYTDAGQISILLKQVPGSRLTPVMVRLCIADTGPGIDPAERRRLFKPYVRGRVGEARGAGSGLGLWGASQLVSELGGKLRLVSPKSGGCRFEIELPIDQAAEAEAEVLKADPESVPNGEAHVLIVDDNGTNRRLLSALLESFSITCDQAPGGPEALKMMADTIYDAVLLDLHMPVMDGLETAEKIRALGNGSDVPLIAVTAALETVGDDQLQKAGFVEALAKPLSPARLFEAMEHARQFHLARRS
ncbi:hybrid sensor histidine kinase/response regulator [Roseibium algae]|uniref:histidine kinase n=1 Tax=Roseibium algae TaxID=3123038 RepID=A0ABU8TQE5_9HYPH